MYTIGGGMQMSTGRKTVESTLKVTNGSTICGFFFESTPRENGVGNSERYLNSHSVPTLLTAATAWEQPGCLLVNKWLSCKLHTHRGNGGRSIIMKILSFLTIRSWTLHPPASTSQVCGSQMCTATPRLVTLSFCIDFNPCTFQLNLYSHTKVLSGCGSSDQSSQTQEAETGGWN